MWNIYIYLHIANIYKLYSLTFVNPISWSKMLAAVSLQADGQRRSLLNFRRRRQHATYELPPPNIPRI